jgi:hypothetical protein
MREIGSGVAPCFSFQIYQAVVHPIIENELNISQAAP